MYKIERINQKYIAKNDKNKNAVYIIPDDVCIALVRKGINKNNIPDDDFNNIIHDFPSIVLAGKSKKEYFDNLGLDDLNKSKDIVETSERLIERKKKSGQKIRVNRKKSRMIKKIIVRVAAGIMAVIMAWSGIGSLKKKLSSRDNDNSYSIENNIDGNKLPSKNKMIIPDEDDSIYNDSDSYDNSDDIIIEDTVQDEEEISNISNHDESTEYYYNLDGEIDRQNWKNVMRYEENFKKAGEKYGIDYKLLMSIACQESSGIHKNNEFSYGIMHVERVHKDEDLAVNNMLTGEVDTLKGTDEYLSDLQGNIDYGTGILQRCLNIAYREGYEKGILKKNEIMPAALHGYNMGFTAEKKMIDNYANSGEESYNYFIRTTISANIDDETLVWHYKYPALVFNERGDENAEYWAYCKSSNGEIDKVFTTAINESKIFATSMKR